MDIDSYMANFDMTTVNQDTYNWELAYFYMDDDPQDPNNQFPTDQCAGCT